ncbi:MAG: NfeD family protein [Terriglobales bacterium]
MTARKSACRTGRWRLGLILLVVGLPAALAAPQPLVVLVPLDGIVQPVAAEHVSRGLHFAAEHGAAAVVLELSTPGGLDTSMRAIIAAILASPVPVIGYVGPSGARAASAGFYILESCDVAAMAPGTNTGAAHPVLLNGEPDRVMADKMQNDAAAFMRSLAQQRHRNLGLAQNAVLQSQSFTEEEALQGGLIDLAASSVDELLHNLNGRTITRPDGHAVRLELAGAQVTEFPLSLRERMLDLDPSMAFMLLSAGIFCLLVEFTHPGAVLPGVVGLLAVVIALFVLSVFPINGAAAGLLLLGVGMMAAEAKFPSHGILAAGGVVGMTLGAVLLIDSPIPEVRIGWAAALGVALPMAGITLVLLRLVLRARRAKVISGPEGLIGLEGEVQSTLAPEGWVFIQGALWRARSTTPVAAGRRVRVRAVDGLVLDVEPQGDPHDQRPDAVERLI